MTTVYGYPARDDITAGQTYTVTIPHISRDKKFYDVVKLVKGIGEYQGSTASYDEAAKTWTVTLAADAMGALDDLLLAEAKYGADVVAVPGDHGYAQASADHAAISTEPAPAADPFANIPNADDSLNGEFSPAARPQQPSIIEPVDQAGYYLRQANDAGLPLPSYVTVSAHHGGSHIGIQLASDEQVRQWARRFGAKAVLTRSGISAAIGDANRHEVSAYYMFPEPDRKPVPRTPAELDVELPGLAEHTQAAPNLADALKSSLAAHTQAACDTITKASVLAQENDE